MPSIVQFTDLNIKQMRLEEKERIEEDRERMQVQLKERSRTRDSRTIKEVSAARGIAVQGRDLSAMEKEKEEDHQTRMRVATIAALAEEIRRRRIVRGGGPESFGGGNGAMKEEPGIKYYI